MFVQLKEVITKDEKAKAREEESELIFSIFVAVGKDFRVMIPYSIPNNVGKITIEVYYTQILPVLIPKLK